MFKTFHINFEWIYKYYCQHPKHYSSTALLHSKLFGCLLITDPSLTQSTGSSIVVLHSTQKIVNKSVFMYYFTQLFWVVYLGDVYLKVLTRLLWCSWLRFLIFWFFSLYLHWKHQLKIFSCWPNHLTCLSFYFVSNIFNISEASFLLSLLRLTFLQFPALHSHHWINLQNYVLLLRPPFPRHSLHIFK